MTFKNIGAGDRVLYTTPQGNVRAGIANPLLRFGGHVVVDAGGQHGRPVVVNESNYLRHTPRITTRPVGRFGG